MFWPNQARSGSGAARKVVVANCWDWAGTVRTMALPPGARSPWVMEGSWLSVAAGGFRLSARLLAAKTAGGRRSSSASTAGWAERRREDAGQTGGAGRDEVDRANMNHLR